MRWLADRGVTITGASADYTAIDRSNRIANFLGNHPTLSGPILRVIKQRNSGRPLPVRLNVTDLSADALALVTAFGTDAFRRGLFTYFYHDRRMGRLVFQLRDDPLVNAYMHGCWFERYTLERAVRVLSALGASDDSQAPPERRCASARDSTAKSTSCSASVTGLCSWNAKVVQASPPGCPVADGSLAIV